MPEAKIQAGQAENNEWRDSQFGFNGNWLPDIDPLLIGAENYADISNIRYKDAGVEGVSGYSKVNTTTLDGHGTLGDFPLIRNGHQLRRPQKTQKTYTLVHALNTSDQGRVFQNLTAIGSQGDFDATADFDVSGNAYYEDSASGLQGRFSEAPQGNVAYCNSKETMIYGGTEQRVAAFFLCDVLSGTVPTNPVDYTDAVNNNLEDAANYARIASAGKELGLLMTTRPIQAVNLKFESVNSTNPSTTTIKYWTGSAWSADYVNTDGTSSGGITMAQDGTITFTGHTDALVKPFHFEELFLYAYLIELSAGSADIKTITVDMAFQTVKDVWDGVYRQPIQFQVYDTSGYYKDFTLQVNESSDDSSPVGADLGGLTTSDHFIIMFEEQMAGAKLTMLGKLINTNNVDLAGQYWNGSAWSNLTETDGTQVGTETLAQTGLISWNLPTDEEPQTLFGSFGYAYKFTPDATIVGTKGSNNVVADLCTGVPAQNIVKPFDFSALFKNRLMMGSYSEGDEGNRLDYSVANAPDAWNGFDSSKDGVQSIYFGGVEPLTGATQIYNRFGASVFSMLLVMKQTQVYILVGDTPEDFVIYPVSFSVGCPCPKTLTVAEVGLELGQGLTRNVALWVSHSGPMMFDGAVLSPIRGVQKFFDPNEDDYIDWSILKDASGWVDPIYKEYNILLPTGSSPTENNEWLVYDLIRRKWFKKDTGSSELPQVGFEVVDTDGQRLAYAGIDTGFMMQLENGTTWADGANSGIRQLIRTGDFYPSGNMWDLTTLRKFKIFVKKLVGSSVDNNLEIAYYSNTNENPGQGVIWESSDAATGADVDWTDTSQVEWDSAVSATLGLNLAVGSQRLIRLIQNLNRTGWSHAFEFILTTTDVTKGFQPVAWGIRYRIERKDDTAT